MQSSRNRVSDKRAPGKRTAAPRDGDGPVGDALKMAYRQTVEEPIPPEMLELLGKLG